MKRVISLMLSVIMILSMSCIAVHADGTGTITVEKVTAKPGETVTFSISVSDNPGIAALQLEVGYGDYLTVNEVEEADDKIFTGDLQLPPNYDSSFKLTWDNLANSEKNGALVNITATVAENAPAGYINVNVIKVTAVTIDEKRLDLDVENGGITVESDKPVECEHEWGEGVVTKEPTCTEDGVRTYTCSKCDETKTEVIPAGHDYAKSGTTDPTCTKQGYTTYTCTRCGDTYNSDYVDALGHSCEEKVIEPTCTEAGEKSKVCTRCGETIDKEVIPALPHDWEEVVTKEATCTEEGEMTRTCKREGCGKTETVAIPKIAHDYTTEVTPATCTEEGKVVYTCKVCGDTKTETIPAAGHKWGDWKVVVEPTESEEGLEERTCSECGAKEERKIAKIDNTKDDEDDDEIKYIRDSLRYYALTQTKRTFTVKTTTNEGGEITGASSVKYGKDATYVITPDEGYEVESVKVNGKDIGAVYEVNLKNVRSNITIDVTFAEIEEAVDAVIEEIETVWENPFVDIFDTDSYYEAIEFVYENGLFKGVSDTEFAPDTTMTRAMFVTVLGRMSGVAVDYIGENTFDDVVEGEWYAPYVAWAADNGIVMGYGDGTFGINNEITIEQAAVIIARYAAFIGNEIVSEIELDAYTDAEDVSDWAADSIKWTVENGIYTGEEDMLNAKTPAKRSIVAVMLYNFSNVLG